MQSGEKVPTKHAEYMPHEMQHSGGKFVEINLEA